MSRKQLETIASGTEIVRAALVQYLTKSGKTLTAFSVEAKMYQSNLFLFLRGKNLSAPTLQKLANYLKNVL
jgi:Ser/Thr protein kinase RdoA (MazF antagonist)